MSSAVLQCHKACLREASLVFVKQRLLLRDGCWILNGQEGCAGYSQPFPSYCQPASSSQPSVIAKERFMTNTRNVETSFSVYPAFLVAGRGWKGVLGSFCVKQHILVNKQLWGTWIYCGPFLMYRVYFTTCVGMQGHRLNAFHKGCMENRIAMYAITADLWVCPLLSCSPVTDLAAYYTCVHTFKILLRGS